MLGSERKAVLYYSYLLAYIEKNTEMSCWVNILGEPCAFDEPTR
jgi:hypothetical protein